MQIKEEGKDTQLKIDDSKAYTAISLLLSDSLAQTPGIKMSSEPSLLASECKPCDRGVGPGQVTATAQLP